MEPRLYSTRRTLTKIRRAKNTTTQEAIRAIGALDLDQFAGQNRRDQEDQDENQDGKQNDF